MRRYFSFSNIIAFAALATLAVLVTTDPRLREMLSGNWQWIGMLLAVIALVTAQVILVRRNLYVLPAGRTGLAEPATPAIIAPAAASSGQSSPPPSGPPDAPLPARSATGTGKDTAAKDTAAKDTAAKDTAAKDTAAKDTAPGSADHSPADGQPRNGESKTPGAPPEASQDPNSPPAIDGNLFTRFRQHLEEVEERKGPNPPPNRAPASEEDVVDRVEISSASRRKHSASTGKNKTNPGGGDKTTSGAGTKPAPAVEEEQEGPDLFSDLRPQPVTPVADEASSEADKPAAGDPAATEPVTAKPVAAEPVAADPVASGTDAVQPKPPASAEPGHPATGNTEHPAVEAAAEVATEVSPETKSQTAPAGGGEDRGSGDTGTDAKPGAPTGDPVAPPASEVEKSAATRLGGGLEGRTPPTNAGYHPEDAPPPPDEVTEALDGQGRDSPENAAAELAEEAAALLRLAEEAERRGVWERLRATLENYLAHLAEAPELVDWNARRLQVRLAVNDRATGPALQAFEDMLNAGYRPEVDEVPDVLEALLEGGERKLADSLRVSMLVRILAAFRQRRDQQAMDHAYSWIEAAQEKVGDEKRLLDYLKNHLDIRKAMGNVPGQLELIDQIGNRCFKLGLTEEAKTYYEMGLKLRGASEGDQAPAGDDPSAVG